MNRVIIIMAKVPRAGNVKTRLQPFLSPAGCCALAEAFLSDTIRKSRSLADKLIIAFSPAAEKDYFAQLDQANLTLIEQQGASLGDKMNQAFKFAFNWFSDANTVMIGTDSPTVPPEFIQEAFGQLERKADIVLGKSADGGFYLIGLREIHAPLFENIEWSSPRVFGQITGNIEQLKMRLQLVPEWYDIDEPTDLRRLQAEIVNDGRAAQAAPQTTRWLDENAAFFEADSNSPGI